LEVLNLGLKILLSDFSKVGTAVYKLAFVLKVSCSTSYLNPLTSSKVVFSVKLLSVYLVSNLSDSN